VPFPTHVLFTLAVGVSTAVAARSDLRVSPRAALLSRSALALAMYLLLVLIPAGLYFYLFHGDWFLLYVVDVGRVPSAMALVACLSEFAVGVSGFLVGAYLVRAQRDQVAGSLIGASLAAAVAVMVLSLDRLAWIGSYRQFHGRFGLEPFGGSLMQGVLWMGLWVLLGLAYLLYRVSTRPRAG